MKYQVWTNDEVNDGVETFGHLVYESDSKAEWQRFIDTSGITPKTHHLEIEKIGDDGLPDFDTIVMWHNVGGLNFGGL